MTPKSTSRSRKRTEQNPAGTPPKQERYLDWDLPTAAKQVMEGLPTGSLQYLKDMLELSSRELADLVMIPPRTLHRRFSQDRLPPDESERVYRIARLAELATEIFRGSHHAADWMKESNFALGDQVPIELARSAPGVDLVERSLYSIRYGLSV